MSKFTSEMVSDYAKKLLIGLSKEENELVLKEFDIIDENMELINKIADINLSRNSENLYGGLIEGQSVCGRIF